MYADMVGHKNLSVFSNCGRQEGLIHAVQSNLETGVTSTSVSNRRTQYGANRLPPQEVSSFMDFVKESLGDKTILILIGAATVSLILGMTTPDPRTGEVDRTTGWIEGFAILVSVLIVTLVSSLNNYRKQEQFLQLMELEGGKLKSLPAKRDGEVRMIPNEEIVVGDIVFVQHGMQLSFDGVLLDGLGILCDESSITGETTEVLKTFDEDPFFVSGTVIVDGADAQVLVLAVGETSFAGSIAMAVREGTKQTPLQEQLEDMAGVIGKYGLYAAILTFVALLLKELYGIAVHGQRFYAMKLFENITTAVAIVVVAVPEGLPLSVTISLAYSMRRMLSDGNLVRHLAACETMGGATVICTDKTGTLTEQNIAPTTVHIEGRTYRGAFAAEGASRIVHEQGNCSEAGHKLFLQTVVWTCGGITSGGNKTSEALLAMCQPTHSAAAASAHSLLHTVGHSRVRRFPFSSLRRQSSVLVMGLHAGSPDTLTHFVCGAAEVILQQCNMVMSPQGQRQPLTAEQRRSHENVIHEMTSAGLRTLCLAVAEKPNADESLLTASAPPADVFTLVAIVGLAEPVRPEVPESLRTCRRAGLRVIMLTGDNLATATTIAQRCGLLQQEHQLRLEGPQLRTMTDDEVIRDVLPSLALVARATPLDKQRIVCLLKADHDQVVAVTGDGTNDAPALKAADIGFAMNSGSDVAKRASDIVLLQDNFAGTVKATMWGRNVRDNIRKFLQFQLTVNLAACIVAFFGAVMNAQNLSPLKPVQLLWLNLIMDTLAALALATELPEEQQLLSRPPEPRGASIMTQNMWIAVSIQSSCQLLVQLYLLAASHHTFSLPAFGTEHLTIVFNSFVWMQVFNFFNARLLSPDAQLFENIRHSTTLLQIVCLVVFCQWVIVQYGGIFMSTTPLTPSEWLYSIAMGMTSLGAGYLSRYCARRAQQGKEFGPLRWLLRRVGSAPKRYSE